MANKNDMMNKFLQDNLIYFLIPIIILGAGGYFSYDKVNLLMQTNKELTEKKEMLETMKTKLAKIKEEKRLQEQQQQQEVVEVKKEPKSGKVIMEVLGQQFSAEASFGFLFDELLKNLTASGVRVRSIEYNYSPVNDKIGDLHAPGYNACELSFTAVGSYSQLQSFFKNLTKNRNLSSIYEIYIEPYDKDKTILIAKFKIRLYTKTMA